MNSLYKRDGGGQESLFEELFDIEEKEEEEIKPEVFSQYWEQKEEEKIFNLIGPKNLHLNYYHHS